MRDFFHTELCNNSIGEWIIALSILLGSFLLAKFIYWTFGNIVKKASDKTKSKIDDLIVDMLREPVVLGLTIFGLWYGIRQLSLPDVISNWIGNFYNILVAVTVTWLIARLVDAVIKEYFIPLAKKTESSMDNQLIPVIRKGLKIFIWILGIIVAMNNAGYNVSALIAGLGIGGLAFALAAKDTIANIFGGVTIFTDKPFKINDRVKIGGFDGIITEVGIRSTRLKTLEGRMVTIPNSKFTDGMVENISAEPSRKVTLNIGLVYETTVDKMEKAMEILKTIVAENKAIEDEHYTGFNDFGDSSLGINFVYFIKKGEDILGTQSAINLEIMRNFELHHLEMAFPTQTIYTKRSE